MDEDYTPGESEEEEDDDEDDGQDMDEDEEEDDPSYVEENPFEPVYPATAGLLQFTGAEDDDEDEDEYERNGKAAATVVHGLVMEAISLDNILPAGQRRRTRPVGEPSGPARP